MPERYGTELRDEVGVANSVRVEQVASLPTHERLIETQALIEESLVRRDVPYIMILLLGMPILDGSERDDLIVQKRSTAFVSFLSRWYVSSGERHSRCRETALVAQAIGQQRTLLRPGELIQPDARHQT